VIGVMVPAPSARLRNGSSILRAVRQLTPSMRLVTSPARCFSSGAPVRYAPTLTASARCMCAASSRRRIRETLAMRLPRALAALAALGLLRVEHLYVEAALFGAVEAFFQPSLSALIPELIPPDVLQAGNALRGSSRQVALLAGPLVGGFLVAFAGIPIAFGVD